MGRQVHTLLVLAPVGLVLAGALWRPLSRVDFGCRALGPRHARADLSACAPGASDAECAAVFRDPAWRTRGGASRFYERGAISALHLQRIDGNWTRTISFDGDAARRDALIQSVLGPAAAAGAQPSPLDDFGCVAWLFPEGRFELCAGWMIWAAAADVPASAAVSEVWLAAGEELLGNL